LSPKVAIRFDVSANVGSGHLRRAIAIGKQLHRIETKHVYVTQHTSANAAVALGIPESNLISFDPSIGETDWINQLPDLSHVITDFCHHENKNSHESVRDILLAANVKVAVIDSMQPYHFLNRKSATPAMVITPYFGAERLRERPHCTKWLTGVDYAILDDSYHLLHQKMKQFQLSSGDYVLLCCGGSDPNHISEYILGLIANEKQLAVNVKVVVGNFFNANRVAKLQKMAELHPKKITLLYNQNNIAELIAKCGIVLGTIGLIRYESACLGKPSHLIQPNLDFSNYLRNFHKGRLGNIYFIQHNEDRLKFHLKIQKLCNTDDFLKLSKPNQYAFDLVDGFGVQRILKKLLSSDK